MINKIWKISKRDYPYLVFVIIALWQFTTSPLYRYTAFNDIDVMLAMGKALMHGVVPFKDIFEQRGLYMYVIHGVGVFSNSAHWLWLVEMLNFYAVYLVLRKLFQLQSDKHLSWKAVITVIMIQFASGINQGASPEEFMLLPNTYAIYLVFKYATGLTTMTNRERFFLSLGLAVIFNIKYSNIGFIGIILLFDLILNHKKWIQVLIADALGFITGWLPVLIYFAWHNYLLQFFHDYFIENAQSTDIHTLQAWLLRYAHSMFNNLLYVMFLCLIFSAASYFAIRRLSPIMRIVLLLMFMTQLLCISLIMRTGASYALPLQLMVIVVGCYGFPYLCYSFGHVHWKWYQTCLLIYPIAIAIILNCVVWSQQIDSSLLSLRLVSRDMYNTLNKTHVGNVEQSKIIGTHGNGLALAYGHIPTNLYLYNKSYPTRQVRYFDQTTIPYRSQPQSADSQYRYIKQQIPKWVSMITSSIPAASYDEYVDGLNDYSNRQHHSVMSGMMASSTAAYERMDKHPSLYLKCVLKINNEYGIYYAPKVLLKHYALIDIGHNRDFDINDNYSTIQLLFIRKSDLHRYPDLQNKVIQIHKFKKKH